MALPASAEPAYRNPTTAFDAEGRLLLRRCPVCDTFYAAWIDFCTNDYDHTLEWSPAAGGGSLFSWVTYRRSYELPRALPVPYTVGLVVLSEGPRVVGIVHADEVDLGRGRTLRLTPDRENDQLYPAWALA